jgi:hypothetical protein
MPKSAICFLLPLCFFATQSIAAPNCEGVTRNGSKCAGPGCQETVDDAGVLSVIRYVKAENLTCSQYIHRFINGTNDFRRTSNVNRVDIIKNGSSSRIRLVDVTDYHIHLELRKKISSQIDRIELRLCANHRFTNEDICTKYTFIILP